MSSIEHRDWQQIDEPQVNRDQRRKAYERQYAKAHRFAGNFCDFQRPTKFGKRTPARNNLPKANHLLTQDIARLRDSGPRRLQYPDFTDFHLAGANSNTANTIFVPVFQGLVLVAK